PVNQTTADCAGQVHRRLGESGVGNHDAGITPVISHPRVDLLDSAVADAVLVALGLDGDAPPRAGDDQINPLVPRPLGLTHAVAQLLEHRGDEVLEGDVTECTPVRVVELVATALQPVN